MTYSQKSLIQLSKGLDRIVELLEAACSAAEKDDLKEAGRHILKARQTQQRITRANETPNPIRSGNPNPKQQEGECGE